MSVIPNSGPDVAEHLGAFGGRYVGETMMPLLLQMEIFDRHRPFGARRQGRIYGRGHTGSELCPDTKPVRSHVFTIFRFTSH